ncbi:signal recognition particle receptor subunit beta-like [Paramacrobiotus metropolitanus]|uniref:signal recognition particle receptor subunit beta-like n=1 Tax=Paramacrobiotus metropolitanus TaxID=2943436 RepID=UPI002446258A|nr:signal recognition particle receptor subunit beta-like [Paramacrobiotus metropolitanus]
MSKSGGVTSKPLDNYSDTDSSALFIVVGVLSLVGIAVLIFYYLIRKQSHKLQFVLLMGRNGAGKTTLFAKLTQDRNVLTVSSLIKNIGWTKNLFPKETKREVQLIDIPGFERIRWDVFESNKALCKGIVFVLDSVTIAKDAQECADILYRILVDPDIQRRKIPILIACNKQDEVAAKDVDVVNELLEKEMNSIRITKYNPSTKKGNKAEFLGKMEKDFAFSQLTGNKVMFSKCICRSEESNEGDDINGVVEFLRTLS